MTIKPDRNLVRVFETVYLRGFRQSMQRLLDGRERTQQPGGASNSHLIAIPLFECLSWAYAMVEALGKDLSWMKSHSDRNFFEAIRFAANKTKHDLLRVVDEHDAFMVPSGLHPMFMGVEGNWKWRQSLDPKDKRNANYVSELGRRLIYDSLIRLESIVTDGIQKLSRISKT